MTTLGTNGGAHGSRSGGAPLGVAVVGLGYWGPNRVRVLLDSHAADVTHVCDLDPERLARVATRYPTAEASTRFEDVLADERIDAVVVATPVFTHADLCARALRAGKHVFVEKPLAASSGEAHELAELARRCDRVLACGHTFVHSPPVRLIKQLLDERALGELHYVSSSRVNLGPYRSDVSVVFDLGPHDFSILRFLFGRVPETVSAVGRDVISPGVADVAFVTATYDDGLVANLELSWLAPSKLRRTVLVGSERMLVYEDGAPEPVRLYDSGIEYRDPKTFGEYHLAYRTGDIVSPRVGTEEPIAVELQEFIAAIRGERNPEPDLELAVDVMRMVEAAEGSMRASGAAMPVLAPERATAQ
jgi:predicted dehydrogenase